jgi:hypothetical protein
MNARPTFRTPTFVARSPQTKLNSNARALHVTHRTLILYYHSIQRCRFIYRERTLKEQKRRELVNDRVVKNPLDLYVEQTDASLEETCAQQDEQLTQLNNIMQTLEVKDLQVLTARQERAANLTDEQLVNLTNLQNMAKHLRLEQGGGGGGGDGAGGNGGAGGGNAMHTFGEVDESTLSKEQRLARASVQLRERERAMEKEAVAQRLQRKHMPLPGRDLRADTGVSTTVERLPPAVVQVTPDPYFSPYDAPGGGGGGQGFVAGAVTEPTYAAGYFSVAPTNVGKPLMGQASGWGGRGAAAAGESHGTISNSWA